MVKNVSSDANPSTFINTKKNSEHEQIFHIQRAAVHYHSTITALPRNDLNKKKLEQETEAFRASIGII